MKCPFKQHDSFPVPNLQEELVIVVDFFDLFIHNLEENWAELRVLTVLATCHDLVQFVERH